MFESVKTFVLILTLLTLTASLGYSFVSNLEPAALSVAYLAVVYMPTPLYALIITNYLAAQPLHIGQYGTLRTLTFQGTLVTIGLFLSWIIVFTLLTSLLTPVAPELVGQFATSIETVRSNLAVLVGAEAAAAANLPSNITVLIAVALVGAVVSGFSVNLLFALGEEYGWRGFLTQHLTGSFIKKHTVIGLMWGLWHAPIILQGYNYGEAYRFTGTLMFIMFTICFGYVFGVIIERHHNVLYAGALHGMFNGFAGVFPLILIGYHPLIGGPVGIVAAAAFVIVAFGAQQLLPPSK